MCFILIALLTEEAKLTKTVSNIDVTVTVTSHDINYTAGLHFDSAAKLSKRVRSLAVEMSTAFMNSHVRLNANK